MVWTNNRFQGGPPGNSESRDVDGEDTGREHPRMITLQRGLEVVFSYVCAMLRTGSGIGLSMLPSCHLYSLGYGMR